MAQNVKSPVCDQAARQFSQQIIVKEYDGTNIRTLAIKYNYSEKILISEDKQNVKSVSYDKNVSFTPFSYTEGSKNHTPKRSITINKGNNTVFST